MKRIDPKNVGFLLLCFLLSPIWLLVEIWLVGAVIKLETDDEYRKQTNANPATVAHVAIAVALAPFWLIVKASRRSSGASSSLKPKGRFVLYLRPFDVDKKARSEFFEFFYGLCVGYGTSRAKSFEVGLSEALGRMGRVVAIGDPREFLPRDGARRVYLGHDAWQSSALDAMCSARAVVIVAGTTPGVRWEKMRIREYVDPLRVLLIFPDADPAVRRKMLEVCSECLGSAFLAPCVEHIGHPGPLLFRMDANWQARAIPRFDEKPSASFWRNRLQVMGYDYEYSLRPFFHQVKRLEDSAYDIGG